MVSRESDVDFVGGVLDARPIANPAVGTADDIDAFMLWWHAAEFVWDDDISQFLTPTKPRIGVDR